MIFTLVSVTLVAEMVIFVGLLAPIPATWRRSLALTASKSGALGNARTGLKLLCFVIAVMLIDALLKYRSIPEFDPHHDVLDHYNARLFRTQRNIYLCGAAVFLYLVLNRFATLMYEIANEETKAE
ncbi:B-cell receptor-associated protein 31-like-domain-containing protein, partial [Blyttiomyces helicus]